MTSRVRRWSIPPLAIAITVATLLTGCEFSGEMPEPPTTETRPAATQVAPDSGAETPGSATPAFGAGDQLFGSFRRASVPVPPELLATAAEQCQETSSPPATPEIGSRPVVVADLRGDGRVLLVFADDQAAVGCRVDVSEDGSMRASLFQVAAPEPGQLADDGLSLGVLDYVDDPAGPLVIAAGQVGDTAVHVRAGFDDDTYTTATIDDGWWLMWWPGQTRPASITADDNRNTVFASVKVP
jgi:hypothetical protein